MGEDYIISLGSTAERMPIDAKSWDAGDPIIQEGIYRLLPELENINFVSSVRIPDNEIDEYVKNCRHIIQTGTPSWINPIYRLFWKACIKYNKRISFLGIGLAVPYTSDFWYGREEFFRLKEAGLIDLVVCRDKLCYYWLTKSLGLPKAKTHLLPCPGFYVLEPKLISEKKNIILSIPNPEETSVSRKDVFKEALYKFKHIQIELEKHDARVFMTYHRHLPSFKPFHEEFKKAFPGKDLNWFPLWPDFKKFHEDKHVYIGVRNHGALPCSGGGIPSLLLGTDDRQHLADEIPFLSKYDISRNSFDPRFIIDWYTSLIPTGISLSLSNWRDVTYQRWQEILKPLKEVINDTVS
ncbi:MAG: hypothetical protein KAQ99_08610 [Candidatus Aureabacteria bacterium]|nr:hypothetical protein [Candidatus Auribacterota bacterium]